MSGFILSAFADEIDMNLDKQMDMLDIHGIKHIEMRGVDGKGLVNYSTKEAKVIKKRLDDRGFKLSAIGSPLGKIMITKDFTPHMDLFKHTLEIAEIMETDYIRVFSFFIPKGEEPDVYRDEVLERLSKFMEKVKGSSVILAHENEKDIYGDTADRCLDLMQELACENFRFVFDPANFIQCNEETYPRAIKMLSEYIEYVHIKDALFKNGEVVPAGYGDGKIAEILKELKKKNKDIVLSLEPHLGSFKGMEGLEQDLDITGLEKGGPGKFSIAANALKKIIREL